MSGRARSNRGGGERQGRLRCGRVSLRVLGALALLLIGVWLGSRWAGAPAPPVESETAAVTDRAAPEEVEIWTCSMHPQIRLPKPGKCPICGMDLIPAESGGGMQGMRTLSVSPAARALMRLRTTAVERRFVEATVRMVGKIDYDETRFGYITAWVPGRIDRLYVDYTGIRVNAGDHMVYLYSPELYAAQEELLQAKRTLAELAAGAVPIVQRSAAATVEAAREKLRLLGLTEEQVAEVEKRGTPTEHLTINSPVSGIVVRKDGQEGMYVKTGTRIFTIADLSSVWVRLDAYESDLAWLRYGQHVEFEVEAYPGERFEGTISFIDPILDPVTRTAKVRVVADNEDQRLKPGMFVHAVARADVAASGRIMDPALVGKWICPMHPEVVKDAAGTCDVCGMDLVPAEELGYVSSDELTGETPLVIPVTAALRTGKRAIVYVERTDTEEPTFEGREVVLGPRAGDWYVVRAGLEEGELVVTHGNFKIDSALQLQAKPSMMTSDGGSGGGHHHGRQQAPEGGGGAMRKEEAGGLGALAREDLEKLERAIAEVRRAARSEDLDTARAAFRALGETVSAIPMENFSGHLHAAWMEVAMRLSNDALVGAEVADAQDLARELERLEGDVRFLHRHVGEVASASAAKRPRLNEPARGEARAVWQAYLALHRALAGDDSAAAREAAKTFSEALEALDRAVPSGPGRERFDAVLPGLREGLAALQGAEGIDEQRAGFEQVAMGLARWLREVDALDVGKVYLMRCPMAFDGRGAEWLQDERDVRNPYYGSRMPDCGVVKGVLRQEGDER